MSAASTASTASTASPSPTPTTFEMPETINGEEPPATVPFVKPASNEQAAIKQKHFDSLEEAQATYSAWVATCNWKAPPTLAFFVWASEHNWDEEDGLRIPEDHKDYYGLPEWEEDMRSKTDDRWFMGDAGELAEYSDTMQDGEPIDAEPSDEASTSPATDSHDDKFWRELEIMGQLRQAEIERQEAQTQFDIKTEERKEAKEHLASCTARVARITAQLVSLNTLPEPKKDQPGASESKAPELATQNTGAQAKTPEQTTGAAEPKADDSWRKEPTANIIKGLPGLGAKKLEAICEKAPTVGDLEDLREKASLHHSPFKEVLPKGCGESIAQAVEDALLDFMFKWKERPDVASTEAAAPSSPSEEQEPQTTPDDLADL